MASLLNMILLFRCLQTRSGAPVSLAGCIIYAGFWLVMDQSVQGRGYTLSNTFLLICLLCVYRIFQHVDQGACAEKKDFVGYAVTMFLALYTVPTNFFWIAVICTAIFLLCCRQRQWPLLRRFVTYGIIAAVLTVLAYSLIWMFIGMRLLGMCEDGSFCEDISVIQWIQKLPDILSAGIGDMLSNEVIQPVGRKEAVAGMGEWMQGLMGEIVGNAGPFSSVAAGAVLCCAAVSLGGILWNRFHKKEGEISENRKERDFLLLFAWISFFMTPLLLILQGTLPFYRCFLWSCISLIVVITDAFAQIGRCIGKHRRIPCGHKKTWRGSIPLIMCLLLLIGVYFYGKEQFEQETNENEIREILQHTQGDVREPDHIIVKKAALDPSYQGYWDDYCLYDDLPWTYIRQNMRIYYETDEYVGLCLDKRQDR